MIYSNPDMLSRGQHPAYLNFGVPVAGYILLYIYSLNFTVCIPQPSFCNRDGCKPLPLCTKSVRIAMRMGYMEITIKKGTRIYRSKTHC